MDKKELTAKQMKLIQDEQEKVLVKRLKNKYNKEDIELIKKLRANGATVRQVSDELNIPERTIFKLLEKKKSSIEKIKPIEFNNVAATEENIINGKYPIWSYGYYVTNGEPNNTMKQFIGYVQSSEFQHKTLPKMGYIPIDSIKK